jgi:hypothetical protein
LPLNATIVQGDSVTFHIYSIDSYDNQRTGDTVVLEHFAFLDTVTRVVGNVVHGVHVGISGFNVLVNSVHRSYTGVIVMPRVHFGGINEDGVVTVRADGDSLAVLVPLSFSGVGVTDRMSWAADSAVVFDRDGILYWARKGSITRQLTAETNVAAQPSITADGQWIYYSWQAGAVWEIHRIKADGTGDSVLVSGAESFTWPSISPDGSTLVYLAGFELRRRDMATGTTTTINARAMSPSWAPDGIRLAFICDNGICLVDANGNDLGQLGTFFTPAPGLYWSRDGDWLLTKVSGYYPELINVDSGGGWIRATVFPPLGHPPLQQTSLSLMP